ncbi:unnamed protein product [Nippostrongylus brasiliensis]|uniref:G_PROTEIN_RECEP_F2_4 domain-containing protein n=1 Tax=Nippostrongylus brasiliensis TaxID=27835 RepID=A0A0N4Y5S8_NIPBR|nr:unnamed protein product [Nippostrongylus brasiliensis]
MFTASRKNDILALFGMAAIGICGLMTGVLWIVGANYCTHPNTIFISGCIAIGLWGGSCLASYILALNRVLDICNSSGLALYLVQTSSICLMNFLSALLYVYMELLPSPQYFGLIGHLFWILGHGTPVVIYMFCNATIRREVNKMYAKFKPASKGEQSTTNGALSIGGAWAQRTRSI